MFVKRKVLVKSGGVITVALGIFLLMINTIGLFLDMRKDGLGSESPEYLRFPNDYSYDYKESLAKIAELGSLKNDLNIAKAANLLVSKSLTHVEWERVDPIGYSQTVPFWENYMLYFLGRFSGLPYYERYHFVNYKKSLERGIGVCGDASMVLSGILDDHGIENRIIAYDSHVVVEVSINGSPYVADPDFGVFLEMGYEELGRKPAAVSNYYLSAGYLESDAQAVLYSFLNEKPSFFDSVYHFLTKRYVFEYLSYYLIWVFPLLLIAFGIYFSKKSGASH